MITLSGAISGAPITGFTTPTFTLTAITATASNKLLSAITAATGTPGASVHSADKPFTTEFTYPSILKTALQGAFDGFSGRTLKVPFNEVNLLTRKSVAVSHPQGSMDLWVVDEARTKFKVYAGMTTSGAVDFGALLSAHAGILSAKVDGIKSFFVSGY